MHKFWIIVRLFWISFLLYFCYGISSSCRIWQWIEYMAVAAHGEQDKPSICPPPPVTRIVASIYQYVNTRKERQCYAVISQCSEVGLWFLPQNWAGERITEEVPQERSPPWAKNVNWLETWKWQHFLSEYTNKQTANMLEPELSINKTKFWNLVNKFVINFFYRHLFLKCQNDN